MSSISTLRKKSSLSHPPHYCNKIPIPSPYGVILMVPRGSIYRNLKMQCWAHKLIVSFYFLYIKIYKKLVYKNSSRCKSIQFRCHRNVLSRSDEPPPPPQLHHSTWSQCSLFWQPDLLNFVHIFCKYFVCWIHHVWTTHHKTHNRSNKSVLVVAEVLIELVLQSVSMVPLVEVEVVEVEAAAVEGLEAVEVVGADQGD